MIQIFLAVSVLVYSVVIATSKFDSRACKLTDCGSSIKKLIREMEKEQIGGAIWTKEQLGGFQQRFSDVVTNCENHERSDFHLTTLEMRDEFFITGFPWVFRRILAHAANGVPYLIPWLMMGFEVLLISDMLGFTRISTQVLQVPG